MNHLQLQDEDVDLLDLDIQISADSGEGRKITRGGKILNRLGGRKGLNRNGLLSIGRQQFSWHKIILRHGAKYDQMKLLKDLMSKCPVKIVPLCYDTKSGSSHFYVENQEAANAIRSLTDTISLPDGHMLQITVDRSPPPGAVITEDMIEKLKQRMSDRYNVETGALNLSQFHNSFSGESFYAPLSRSNVFNKVMHIVSEHIPDLCAIDLSGNHLRDLDSFTPFADKFKNLRVLYLHDNKIIDLKSFVRLKDLNVVECKLDGNRLNLGSSYIDIVRKYLPKLQILDGKPLPKQIGFEDEDEDDTSPSTTQLPATIPKYIKEAGSGDLVLQFLQQFFKLYDSDNRQPLLDAYDENALMSMSVFGASHDISRYLEKSRNILRIKEYRQNKLLQKGRLPIVSFLSELPKTQHDLSSFTLDVPLITPSLMAFTVTGLFKEREKNKSVRHFNRCFLVTPRGSGFCIVNETLHISVPSSERAKSFAAVPVPLPAAAVTAELDPAAKRTMAEAFSTLSGMNMDWTVRCLEENGWNYEKAGVVFTDLNKNNKIPPEAFVK